MIEKPEKIVESFVRAVNSVFAIGLRIPDIPFDLWEAPHRQSDLIPGHGAVYVFTLKEGSTSEAGAGRALKVGKAGPNSNPRFRYQHYSSGSAKSTLAGAIENNPLLWKHIGFEQTGGAVGEWLKENTDRDNFYVPEIKEGVLELLEVYLKANLGPVFEGSLGKRIISNIS